MFENRWADNTDTRIITLLAWARSYVPELESAISDATVAYSVEYYGMFPACDES